MSPRPSSQRQVLKEYTHVDHLIADYERGVRPQIAWTNHALERFVAMRKQSALSSAEVADTIASPNEIYKSHKYQAMNLRCGRLTVSILVGRDGLPIVATLLWATQDDWRASYEQGELSGREQRDDLTHLPTRAGT